MYKILKKEKLAENTYSIQLRADEIAKKAMPGQFVMLQIDEKGERIPLSIADFDKNSVTLVFAAIGKTTMELAKLKKGNPILHLAGPMGNPTDVRELGTVCLVGGGFGIAPIYPIARAMKKAGNKVVVIAGARSKKLLFWEEKLSKVCDNFIITTDDGSSGRKGLVTDCLEEVIKKSRPDIVYAIGPPAMMRSVAKLTRQRIRTIASLNSIMLDGIGMCGSCRVRVAGDLKFACVDGPEFNAHAVEWASVINRNKRYEEEEKHVCRCRK